MTRIRTAKDMPIVQRFGGNKGFVEGLVKQRWGADTVINWSTEGAVQAEINRSNWVVRCSLCNGAQVIEPGEPFFCVDCLMTLNNRQAMAIVMPEDRAKIEAILVKRPPDNRNWLIGETVIDLELENIEHGIRG